jgi:hypothetical protein
VVGKGPFGTRHIANVVGGQISGDRIAGVPTGAGADWLLVGDDGFARLDIRATIGTHDDALIYVQYFGVLEVTAAVAKILGGAQESTDYGDQYFFVCARLETGNERYAWVNQTMFVGQGRLPAGPIVEYRIFRVEN